MKILYGINGEGLGHLNRSLLIIEKLKLLGHKVKIASSNKFYGITNIIIPGINFNFNKNGILKTKAIKDYLKLDKNHIIDYNPDLIISDFEPIVANFGRKNKIPVISIDNQHRFDYLDRNLPLNLYINNIFLKITNKFFIGNVQEKITTCFYDIPNSIGPILPDIDMFQPQYNLIYVKDFMLKDIINSLEDDLYIFFSNNSYPELVEKKFIQFPLGNSYKTLFKMAKSIISNAGHQTISECLYYNIPLKCYPIKNQPEQLINKFYFDRTTETKKNGLETCIQRLSKWLK